MSRDAWVDAIRFPLIAMVVLIHAHDPVRGVNGEMYSLTGWGWISDYVLFLVSEVFSRVAVPTFFLISGYYFFRSISVGNVELWKNRLFSRLRSVFVPYLIWNLLWFGAFYCGQSIGFVHVSPDSRVPELSSLNVWEGASFVFGFFDYPIAYHFWFIRDLLIFFLISIVAVFVGNSYVLLMTILVFCFWLLASDLVVVPSIGGAAFFLFGIFLARSGKGIGFSGCSYYVLVLYFFMAFVDFFVSGSTWYWLYKKIEIFFGVISVFVGFRLMADFRFDLRILSGLSGASFFVFAFHEPLLLVVKKATFGFVSGSVSAIFGYFFAVVVVVLTSLAVFYFLKRFFPRGLSVMCGGR